MTSVITASVPKDPAMSFDRSKPVTFLTTVPPDLKVSPRPLTALKPRKWSRAAPTLMRRGPARLHAMAPPMVPASPSPPSRMPRSAGSKAICWLFWRSAASISARVVAAPAVMNSSLGS